MPSRVVLKYPLSGAGGCQHSIPEGSLFLDLQVQDGVPVMWWSAPLSGPSRLRSFYVAPTGPPGHIGNTHYVGTFQLGGFVGHVFSWEAFDRA